MFLQSPFPPKGLTKPVICPRIVAMTTLLLEAAVALTAASAGAAAGWCFRRTREAIPTALPNPVSSSAESAENEAANCRQVAKDLLSQVQGLTTKVASQVGEHNLRVQAINDQLTSGDKQDPQSITNAVTRLVEANAWMQQQLDSAETKLESQARLIESHVNEARTDALTGIANRRAFDEEMQRCLDGLRLERLPASVMMVDVDFFKKFNDAHGHKAGDEVLRHVARSLEEAAGAAGLVCRYGGEEFAIIFRGLTAAAALPLAERCRAAIGAQSISYEGQILNVKASAGLSEFASHDTIGTVLERADEALYASKRSGRNCSHLHTGRTVLPFASAAEQKISAPEDRPLQDLVTGLSTRDVLRDDLQRRLAAIQRDGQTLSLVIVQVDRLNDWLQKGGDEGLSLALRTVANALKGISRDMDHAARFEDDSLAIALNNANLEAAVDLARRLRNSLQSARPLLAGQPTQVTVSIGVCDVMLGDDVARMFLRAQAAQNTSSNLGGNQIATHDGKRIRLVEEAAVPV